MDNLIQVNYKSTTNTYQANKWLQNLPDLFAADFEVASKFTKKEKEYIVYKLDNHKNLRAEEKRVLLQQLTSDGLSHPSLTVITHLSVAWNSKDSFVLICNNNKIRELALKFLVTTNKQQLWHNCVFDFKHIYYYTKLLPKNYIDTQLLAKSLLNDADNFRSRVKLKELMAYAYGDWGISKDDFTLEEMLTESTIRYSATDSAATYKLYQDILSDLKKGERNE